MDIQMNQISESPSRLPISPAPSPLLTSAPTLADVLSAVAESDLPLRTVKQISADIRIVASWWNRDPVHIAAHPGVLRNKLASLHHQNVGVSAKRLANIKCSLRRGLELIGHVSDRPSTKPIEMLTGCWRELWDLIAGSWRAPQLAQFFRFCAAQDVAPEGVTDATFDAWEAWRAAGTASIARDPGTAVTKARRAWNNCVRTVPGWPRREVDPGARRVRVTLPIEHFAPAFADDVDLFRQARGVRTSNVAKRRFRTAAGTQERSALSTSKTQRCIDAVLLAATTAVEEGMVPLHGITGIASILTVEIAAATLERIVVRNGLSEYLLTVAKNLAAVARRWLDLSPEGRADWSDLVYSARAELRREVGFDPLRMTRRNRHRLAQLSDPRAVRTLFTYPWAVMSDLEAQRQRRRTVSREMALRAMSAVAVAILTTLPLRRGTLGRLRWDDHVVLPIRKGPGRLVVPAREVKNRRDLAAPLSPEVVALMASYRRLYWPVLTDGSENSYVFPAARGTGPRSPGQLSATTVKRIRARTGLTMNLHLFRHLMATLALTHVAESGDMKQGAALVEGLLGATPGSGIVNRYAELSSRMAAEWMDKTIAVQHRPRSRLPAQRGSRR